MTQLLLTAFALVMFAANSLLCRMALGDGTLDAASYASLRLVSGALVLWSITKFRDSGQQKGDQGNWTSAFYLFLYAVPFAFAYNGLTTGTGALILFGCVQLTMLLIAWRAGERPSTGQWAGLVVAFGGLVYLLLPGLQAPPTVPALLMILAGVAWGLYTLRGRGAGDPLLLTTGNFARAVPMALVVSAIALPWSNVSWTGIVFAVLSGAIASALGYVAWYAALKQMTATRASTVQLVVPVLAALSGVLVLSEPFGLRLGIATVLVMGGVVLTQQRKALTGQSK